MGVASSIELISALIASSVTTCRPFSRSCSNALLTILPTLGSSDPCCSKVRNCRSTKRLRAFRSTVLWRMTSASRPSRPDRVSDETMCVLRTK